MGYLMDIKDNCNIESLERAAAKVFNRDPLPDVRNCSRFYCHGCYFACLGLITLLRIQIKLRDAIIIDDMFLCFYNLSDPFVGKIQHFVQRMARKRVVFTSTLNLHKFP